MIHFFCATPLQIYTVLVLCETEFKKDKKTIYIIDYFNGCDKYISRLRCLRVFDDVKKLHIKEMYNRIKTRNKGYISFVFWNLFYYLSSARVLKRLQIEVNKKDSVFFSYLEPLCLMLTKANRRKRLELHFCGFEDGIGAYTIPLDRSPGRFERYLSVEPFFKKECYWIYRPKFVVEESKKCHLKKISHRLSENTKELLLGIWPEAKEMSIDKKIIFFDDTIEEKVLESISKELVFYKDNMIVKKHPKRMDDFYERKGYKVLAPQSVPFESMLIRNDFGNSVLINTFSSAVVNSVFMFDQRPTIIFLYEILEENAYKFRLNEIRTLIASMKQIYGDENKIFVPKTKEEFRKLMLTIPVI